MLLDNIGVLGFCALDLMKPEEIKGKNIVIIISSYLQDTH